VVGTASNAGKSILAAGLCRHFADRGIKVAPFKAQNMSLNSFVTKDGGEMGRAQVVQAEAAGIDPHTDMNPVLLKPLGEAKCQVILNGKAFKNLSAKNYYEAKTSIRREALAAYDRLQQNYDLIILEGAGSPAEINLLKDDFVNLKMAEYARAYTILVADIDRGGVFAAILGTIKLVPARLRKYIKGIVINKFRGDKKLLDPGIEEIEKMTGIPVLGVLPYIYDLGIEEEDSVALDERSEDPGAVIDIAVIRLPRISNYTDFLALESTPGVKVRYVKSPEKLRIPDLIIIPGTKNTIADMQFLNETAFSAALKTAAGKDIPIVGICGGYQILGKIISDPVAVEGSNRKIAGLGLLPISTTLASEKELSQVSGTVINLPFAKAGTAFTGYEIHAGVSQVERYLSAPLEISKKSGSTSEINEGCLSANGLIFGTYIHGIFDEPSLRQQLLDWLLTKKGLGKDALIPDSAPADKFNRLANCLAENLDLDFIGKQIKTP